MRGIAFLLVFASHAGLDSVVPGGFGVTIFFFLSGYLITTLLRVERTKTGTVSLKQFYLRRALRILPPFYLVLGGATLAALLGWVPGGVSARALSAQALHLANYWTIGHGYQGEPGGTGVYWSLAVEEHFYLVFPCIFLLLLRFTKTPARRAVALWTMCGAMLLWRCILVFGFHATEDRTSLASDTRVDSILFGCALALWNNPVLDGPSLLSERTWKWWIVPGAVTLLVATFLVRDQTFRQTFRYTLQGIALTPVFIAAIRFPTWRVFRPLNLPIAGLVGTLSYSLYLVHQVLLYVFLGLPLWERAALAMSVSFALAWGIHKLVEKPCAKLRKRLSAKSSAAAPRAGFAPVASP